MHLAKIIPWFAASLIVLKWAAELLLEHLNRRHVLAHANAVPTAFKDTMDEPTYAKSVQYALAPTDKLDERILLAEVKRDLNDDSRAEFRLLDIKAIDAGTYTLSVSVTDKKRVQTLTRSREIEITN